ncbi:PREDICTED: F-box/kelch-repeat protein At3g23880-like [Lupinus angustifolius]|nr:PREDICTED: F-box/kelch-repeat protein At3g23880-like [Lupinus angustifolius]
MPLSSELLPDELVIEILLKLPVKSLLRFISVCKSWNSLIFTPNFVKKHLHHSASDSTLQYHRLLGRNILGNVPGLQFSQSLVSLIDNPSQSPFDSLLSAELHSEPLVVGSCNGLICWVYFDDYSNHYACYLNPMTRSESKSPRISHPWGGNHCLTRFGFGYDHLSDSYKTVGVYCDPQVENVEDKTLVQVYTLGDPSNSWRKMPSFPFVPSRGHTCTSRYSDWCGKLVSNTLNWLCVRPDAKGSLVVVSVDLGKETCVEVLLPVVDKYEPIGSPKLWVLGGCLCFSYDFDGTHFVLWQMKEYGVTESWTILLNIFYGDVGFEHIYGYFPKPFIMLDTGEVLLHIKFDGVFILYNPIHKSFKYLEFQNEKIWFEGTTYIESLMSPCLAPY